jgi:hypothetical protein
VVPATLAGIALAAALGVSGAALPARVGETELGVSSLLVAPGGRQIEQLDGRPALAVETRSARAITLVLERAPAASVTTHGPWTLSSPVDARFAEPSPALRVGVEQQVVGFDARRRPVHEHRVHLLFPMPMRPGVAYRLHPPPAETRFATVLDRRRPPIDVVYRPDRISGSVQVNQVGYPSNGAKRAFVGNWLGTAGPMPVDGRRFEVLDERTDRIVLDGVLTPRAPSDAWSGNDVYEADFSALTRHGRYRLRVPGIGVSDAFEVAPDVYADTYRTVMRTFYHVRNSTPVLEPWADPGHARPHGGIPRHVDAVYHPGVPQTPLGRGEAPHGPHPVQGGWFDAGDYGQYIPNAAPVWYVVSASLDVAPGNFRDADLGIPESGNGIPDVIDELDWGMDWALAMQDHADGGVYFRVASRIWDESLPHEVTEPRFVAEKTTHATASFAAMAAIHARLLADYDEARARRCLDAAMAAWTFLEKHPQWPAEGVLYRNAPGMHAGEYPDQSARDNRLWAAAELYRTTGKAVFRDAYHALVPDVAIDPTNIVSFKDQAMAALWAYAMAPWPDRDPVLAGRARQAFVAAADWRIRQAAAHPYRAGMHDHRPYAGWGAFAHATRATLTYFQAYRVTGDSAYRRAAWSTPDNQLGANPQSLSYVTGIGARSPRHPLSNISRFDGVEEPLRGIPVNGPHYYLPALWPQMGAVNSGYVPDAKGPAGAGNAVAAGATEYPALRRYTDSRFLPPMSEPTVAEVARVGMAFGLLRDERLSPAPASAVDAGRAAR